MIRPRIALATLLLLAPASLAPAQSAPTTKPSSKPAVKPIPPPGNVLPPAERAEMEAAAAKLGSEIESLRTSLAGKPELLALLPDIQIYHNALRYPLKYDELLDVKKARKALADGLERVRQLREGRAEWVNAKGPRGYVSKIDGSVQPYELVLPPSYKPGESKERFRIDVSCHGRAENLTELNFLAGAGTNAGPGEKFILNLYGRYCNANKFAGEIDCLEALADVERRYPIDPHRRVVIGFSMGGAAAWQFAVHYSDLWAAASPGAGFSESKQFLKLSPEKIAATPWYEQRLWRWYDCDGYVANLRMLPTIAYAGEIDGQKQASDVMLAAAEADGFKIERLIGPKTAHAYEKATKVELDKRLDALAAKGRDPAPKRVSFSTYTLRYNQMDWVTVDGLERHWEQAHVDAELAGGSPQFRVKTRNVSAITLRYPSPPVGPPGSHAIPNLSVEIDGANVGGLGTHDKWSISLVKVDGKWGEAQAAPAGPRKVHGLQGPIDDAFLDRFLIVKPSWLPRDEKVGAGTTAECDHAIDHWRKTFRGEPPVKRDREVTEADIADCNLVLFGDPSSNKLIGRVLERMPVKWTADAVTIGERSFPAAHHVPALIYPNPLNPKRYVVINSGFTFREADYLNNAKQIPRLPDYAVLNLDAPPDVNGPGKVALGGFFGEQWELRADDGR